MHKAFPSHIISLNNEFFFYYFITSKAAYEKCSWSLFFLTIGIISRFKMTSSPIRISSLKGIECICQIRVLNKCIKPSGTCLNPWPECSLPLLKTSLRVLILFRVRKGKITSKFKCIKKRKKVIK